MKAKHWDKVADEYFKNIISPFRKGVKNPIFRMIREIKNRQNKSVLEVGCGTGTLIPFLSKEFKDVTAIDFSRKMIKIAGEKNSSLENVELIRMDAVNINRFHRKFDVVVSVNSVLMPDIIKVNKILKRMHNVLEPRGYLVGVFPSMDTLVYEAMINYDKEYDKFKDRRKARRAANKIVDRRFHDFCYGFLYASRPGDSQKHFFGFEVIYRLKKAGFKNIQIKKVLYPWGEVREKNPDIFKDKLYDKLWDWGVSARH